MVQPVSPFPIRSPPDLPAPPFFALAVFPMSFPFSPSICPITPLTNRRFENNQSTGGIVENNILSGAFAFGIVSLPSSLWIVLTIQAVATARDFVISNNSFAGNVSFVCPLFSSYFLTLLHPSSTLPLLIIIWNWRKMEGR